MTFSTHSGNLLLIVIMCISCFVKKRSINPWGSIRKKCCLWSWFFLLLFGYFCWALEKGSESTYWSEPFFDRLIYSLVTFFPLLDGHQGSLRNVIRKNENKCIYPNVNVQINVKTNKSVTWKRPVYLMISKWPFELTWFFLWIEWKEI